MDKVYAILIMKGKKTLDDVPALLRGRVQDILAALSFKIMD
ncbi:CD1375 family protein [Anaerotruncus colihominis]